MYTDLIRTVAGVEVPAAGIWEVPARWASVELVIRPRLGAAIDGRARLLEGAVRVAEDPADSNAVLTIDATSVVTGRPDRDEWLQEVVLDARKHPVIHVQVSCVTPGSGRWDAAGWITACGASRPATYDWFYDGVYRRGPAALFRLGASIPGSLLGPRPAPRRAARSVTTAVRRIDIMAELHARLAERSVAGPFSRCG
jgi:polyisoprenoid-binding protein YceI